MANEGIEETGQASKLHLARPQPGQVAPVGGGHFYSDSACAEVELGHGPIGLQTLAHQKLDLEHSEPKLHRPAAVKPPHQFKQ